MSFEYSAESRRLQDRYDTRRLADRLADVKVHERFTASDREFIEERDMFFLATVDEQGHPTCSYKGGDPGFVTVMDDTSLAFPNYDGNGMYLSMGNLSQTGNVGLLFIDFEARRRLRVDGGAELVHAHPLLDRYPEAQFMVVVRARAIYPTAPGTSTATLSSSVLHSFRGNRCRLLRRTGSARIGLEMSSRMETLLFRGIPERLAVSHSNKELLLSA